MRVLVTGASGFLGANLCHELEKIDIVPVAAIRKSSDLWRLNALTSSIETFELDMSNVSEHFEQLSNLSIDAIVNCAGYGVNYNEQDPIAALEINCVGALRLAEFAFKNSIRFIQIGTAYEYGDWANSIVESTPLRPTTLYGKTKAAGSLAVSALGEAESRDFAILRLFSMYGPLEGQHKIVPSVMNAIKDNKVFDLTAGEQSRDYTYVGDVAKAIILALKHQGRFLSNVINICSGRALSLRRFLETAAPKGFEGFNWGAKPYRSDEMMSVVGHPDLANELLGWSAATQLDEGMAKTATFEVKRPQGK